MLGDVPRSINPVDRAADLPPIDVAAAAALLRNLTPTTGGSR